MMKALVAGAVVALLAVATASNVGASGQGGLAVAGTQLTLDGQPFLPQGFDMLGALGAPPSICDVTTTPPGSYSVQPFVDAYKHFGTAEMAAAKQYNANTLRMEIDQYTLAHGATNAQGNLYAQHIASMVQTEQNSGFVVDLAMQSQWDANSPAGTCSRPTNGGNKGSTAPSSDTSLAWTNLLAVLYATISVDEGRLMLELFNEPQDSGKTWQADEQNVLNSVRAAGANNVVIVDAPWWAQHLDWIPSPHMKNPITDTAGGRGIAYGVHPYQFIAAMNSTTPPQVEYGNFAAQVAPVIATEWNCAAWAGCDWTQTAAQTDATNLLTGILQPDDIGVLGEGLDFTHDTADPSGGLFTSITSHGGTDVWIPSAFGTWLFNYFKNGMTIPTTASLAVGPSPSIYGQAVTFTSIVSAANNQYATPEGSVTFEDGTTPLGSANLVNDTATLTVATLSVAGSPHNITASYVPAMNRMGTTSWNASSNNVSQVVNPDAVSLAYTGPLSARHGKPLRLSGILSSALGTFIQPGQPVSGRRVVVIVAAAQSCTTPPSSSSGVVSCTIHAVHHRAGNVRVLMRFPGDSPGPADYYAPGQLAVTVKVKPHR